MHELPVAGLRGLRRGPSVVLGELYVTSIQSWKMLLLGACKLGALLGIREDMAT